MLLFARVFHDLIKPQWLALLVELKCCGGLGVQDLCTKLGQSYMTVKGNCERLTELGYLRRSRVPRKEVGRPEVFYRLAPKADELFPGVPMAFTLGLLEDIRQLFGENAPERLLFRYFQRLEGVWVEGLRAGESAAERAGLLVGLREKDGVVSRVFGGDGEGLVIREFSNPLHAIFKVFPQAISMEVRAMEGALGWRLVRVEVDGLGVEFRFGR